MKKYAISLLFVASLTAYPLNPQPGAWHGMAGITGPYALFYSPGNLSLPRNPNFVLLLPYLGLSIGNNAFSLSDYNRYATMDTLYDSTKISILNKIGENALKLGIVNNTIPIGISMGSFGIAARTVTGIKGAIPRDILDLGLFGNELGRTYDFSPTGGEFIHYIESTIGGSYPTQLNEQMVINPGISIGYIYSTDYGINLSDDSTRVSLPTYFKIDSVKASLVSDSNYIGSKDSVYYRYASGGSGYTINLGISSPLNPSLTGAISFNNILSDIYWNQDPRQGVGYANLRDFKLQDLRDSTLRNGDSMVQSGNDTSITAFHTKLPPILNIGLAYRSLDRPLLVYLDYIQGFANSAISTTTPAFSAGAEYNPVGFLPIRLGFTVGGDIGFGMSAGMGVSLPIFYFDLGYTAHNGLFMGAKGHEVNFAMGFRSPLSGQIRGTIQDSMTNEPLIASIDVITPKNRFTRKSDSLGFFSFKVPEGKTHIKIVKKDYFPKDIFVDMQPKQKVKLNVKLLAKAGELVLKVVDKATQKPIDSASVMISSETEVETLYVTDSIGEVNTKLIAGKYNLKIKKDQYKVYRDVVIINPASTIAKRVELIPTKGKLLGKVFNAKTLAPLKAQVVVLDSTGKQLMKTGTTADGKYSFILDAGIYTAKATAPKYLPRQATIIVEGGLETVRDFALLKKHMRFTFRNIYFDFNKSTLRPESFPVLDSIVVWLKENSTARVRIEGHTDTRGSRRYNQKLSQARANSVKKYLIDHGIDPVRLQSVGYGESRPVVFPEKSAADYQKNRRVEFLILGQIRSR